MDSGIFRLLCDISGSVSLLGMHTVESTDADLSCMDAGLRRRFQNGDRLYETLRRAIKTELSFGVILYLQDPFLLNYVVFQMEPDRESFCVMGPFITESENRKEDIPYVAAAGVLAAAEKLLTAVYGPSQWKVKAVQLESPQHSGRQYSRVIRQTVDYIQRNLHSKLDLAILAQQIGFSPTYVSHNFKKEVGVTPMQYITQQRMQLARRLLRTTDKPIQEVAGSVGINDWSYFAKLFKQSTGLTPTQYRDRKGKEQQSNPTV